MINFWNPDKVYVQSKNSLKSKTSTFCILKWSKI